jgi:hypothetical protein
MAAKWRMSVKSHILGVSQLLRVRFETQRGPLEVLFGTDERPEEWALRLLRWKPKPLVTRSAKGFETDS